MTGRRRILSAKNGRATARLIVVATAPGRHGAERTGVPLAGDRSGEFFEFLLDRGGLTRADVFVTNAVLCNPQDEAGRNAEPTATEIANCRRHLSATLNAVAAPLVVAMGRTAFAAVAATSDERIRFEAALGVPTLWAGRQIVATYHPSPRVVNVASRRDQLVRQWDTAIAQVNACAKPV